MSQLDAIVQDLLSIKGAVGAAIGDLESGMALGSGGDPGFDVALGTARAAKLVRTQVESLTDLALEGEIEDVLVTLDSQYHIINVLTASGAEGLFVYLVLDRRSANLGIARHKLRTVAAGITF